MKINKIFLLAAMALTGFGLASCSDDDSYSPGKPAGSNEVYFMHEAHQALDLTATSFNITVGRADAGSAISVPLKQVQVASVFTVPATVEFAAGQTEVEVPIQISADAQPFTDYQLRLAIPEEYTNPYTDAHPYFQPELNILVHKEDYKDYAAIEYYDDFWYGESWEDVIQYSATLDLYRYAPFADGCYFYYKIDEGKDITVCNAEGKKYTGKTVTGLSHSTYGAVSAAWDTASGFSGYNPEDDTYYILYEWTVAAGSFGPYYNTIKILRKL
jgi:hypothetical protein